MTAPIVSVVIPTYNRAALVSECLRGLERLTFDRSAFEVIVVDDGSAEPIDHVVGEFEGRLSIVHVRQPRAGPGAARNTGVAKAKGRYAAFIDDDCVPAPGWLSILVEALDRNPAGMVGGSVVNTLLSNRYADASDRISRFVYAYYGGTAVEPFFTTNNLAVSVDRFRDLGGFTTRLPSATAEDKEFCDRWRGRGWPLVQVPAAIVHHAHNLTLAGFLRQHFNYGRGILAFRLIRRARVDGPIVPEPLGFYTGLVTSPLRDGGGLRATALVALAQVATAAGALREAVLGGRPPAGTAG